MAVNAPVLPHFENVGKHPNPAENCSSSALPALPILVVDDEDFNRDALSRRLRNYGHEVDIATNGKDALLAIEAKTFGLVPS
jgi:PleD family two-component response regulator